MLRVSSGSELIRGRKIPREKVGGVDSEPPSKEKNSKEVPSHKIT
jgi:hypothetical protein